MPLRLRGESGVVRSGEERLESGETRVRVCNCQFAVERRDSEALLD